MAGLLKQVPIGEAGDWEDWKRPATAFGKTAATAAREARIAAGAECVAAEVRFGPGRFVSCTCGARVEGAASDDELALRYWLHGHPRQRTEVGIKAVASRLGIDRRVALSIAASAAG